MRAKSRAKPSTLVHQIMSWQPLAHSLQTNNYSHLAVHTNFILCCLNHWPPNYKPSSSNFNHLHYVYLSLYYDPDYIHST